jgi:hypothetical protein
MGAYRCAVEYITCRQFVMLRSCYNMLVCRLGAYRSALFLLRGLSVQMCCCAAVTIRKLGQAAGMLVGGIHVHAVLLSVLLFSCVAAQLACIN